MNQETSLKSSEGPVFHERYNYSDGNIIFMAGSILFRVHAGILGQISELFVTAQEFQHSDTTTESPHYIPQTTAEEFADFLGLAYGRWALEPYTAIQALNVLKLSSRYNFEPGRKWAITALERLNLPVSQRLEISRNYRLDHWLSSCVSELLRLRLNSLSYDDLCRISFRYLSVVARAQEHLREARLKAALYAPRPPASLHCDTHEVCCRIWDFTWWNVVARQLLNDRTPLPLISLDVELRKITWNPAIHAECLELAIKKVERACFGVVELDIETAAVKLLKGFQDDT